MKRLLQAALLIGVLASFASRASGADELTMKDVQALDAQKNWIELLQKADRVKPADRTPDWNRLVRSAATRVLEKIAKDSSSGAKNLESLIAVVPAAEGRYPFLKEDKGYLDGKAKALQGVVAMCMHGEYRGCGSLVELLADGIERFPKGMARDIALLLDGEKAPAETVHFWALAADDDKANCKHARFVRAVIDALRRSTQVATAQRAAGVCYAAIETALLEELVKAADGSAYVTNACPVLKANGTMTVAKKKRCP